MIERIQEKLRPVCRRQRLGRALNTALRALAVTAFLAIAIEALRRGSGAWASSWPALALLVIGPVLGGLVGLLRPLRWADAAAAVDARFRLKDRAGSALDLAPRTDASPLTGLVVEDAADHLASLDTRHAAPLRPFRGWWGAPLLAALAFTLAVWPGTATTDAAPSEPLVPLVRQAETVEENVKELEKLAKEHNNRELNRFAREMKKQTEAMKQPGHRIEDALKRLSSMQLALRQKQAQYNTAAVNRQLQALAGAMAGIAPMNDLARSLKSGNHEKAAKQLEKMGERKLSQRQRRQLKKNLEKTAEQMRQAGMKSLAGATGQLADAAGGEGGGMGKAGKSLAEQVRQHARRKRINQWMDKQLARLRERKTESIGFRKKMCKQCNGTGCSICNGSGLKTSPSNRPSQKAGRGSSDNPNQDPTQLDSQRNRVRLTGEKGSGPTQKQVTRTTGGKQQAGRSYEESYQEYRKRSEAVLENEAIPLGHRRSIRRYFELIRP